ncbi:hypothetical protein SDJN02_20078, partial [Cucurbita argyrosperma subsp. argyrosperma]
MNPCLKSSDGFRKCSCSTIYLFNSSFYNFFSAVLAIILVGLLYGFFIAIICGQRINERHYHVLAKQELTKEYIVEDREHNKNVPELDPSHVMELRMLGLLGEL